MRGWSIKSLCAGVRKRTEDIGSLTAVAELEASAAPGRLLEIQNCHLSSDTWNQYLHFNKIPS